MKKKLKQIQFRKDFIFWFNTRTTSDVVSDECFQAFQNKFGLNCIFETESNGGDIRKYVLLTVTELPSPEIFKFIKESRAMVMHRIRYYKKNGFLKTYCY